MGFAHKGICHSTQPLAAADYCQSLFSSGFNTSGKAVIFNCTAFNTTTATISKLVDTTTTTQIVPLPAFIDCKHDGGANMSLDYFGVGLALLAIIWAAKRMMVIFTGHKDPI